MSGSTTDTAESAPQRVSLASGEVARFCWISRQHAAAARATADQLQRAGEVLRELLQRGVSSVPFGVVLDWVLLIELEWDFPFRSLTEAPLEFVARPLPAEYENECLTPYLLSPNMRRVREVMTLRDQSVERVVHLLERLFEGLEASLPVALSHFHLDPSRLVPSLQEFAGEPAEEAEPAEVEERTAKRDNGATGAPARPPGASLAELARSLHLGVADFLRERLASEPRPGARVAPWRPSDVDLYELEHVEIFASRATRLQSRRLGELAQALGPLDTRRLVRAADLPEVVVHNEDETLYPAGGVAELTTSGSFENLLPSELIYLEDPNEQQVDLFSLKYVENELLYFVRDAGLLVRRRRLIRVVIWEAHGFRVKMPHQAYPFDQYLGGLLLRLSQDLFDYFKGEGVHLSLHWCFAKPDSATQDTSADSDTSIRRGAEALPVQRSAAAPGAPGGSEPARHARGKESSGEGHTMYTKEPEPGLFDLLFRAEREKRLASFAGHAGLTSLVEAMSAEDNPLAQWLFVIPPQAGRQTSSVADALAPLVRLRGGTLREGNRPVHLLHWASEPLPAGEPLEFETLERFGPLSMHDYPHLTMFAEDRNEPRLREARFAFPAQEADPTASLRELRQFLINLLISVA